MNIEQPFSPSYYTVYTTCITRAAVNQLPCIYLRNVRRNLRNLRRRRKDKTLTWLTEWLNDWVIDLLIN